MLQRARDEGIHVPADLEEGLAADPVQRRQARHRVPRVTQTRLDGWVEHPIQYDLDMAYIRFFVGCGIPFKVSRSEWYLALHDVYLSQFKGPYRPHQPGSELLRTTLLSLLYAELDERLRYHRESWSEGVTFMTDDWSTQANRPLCNYLVAGRLGASLYCVEDMFGRERTGAGLYLRWRELILEIGAQHVVAICTDNALANKEAYHLLRNDQDLSLRKIAWIPCAAHCCNLMLTHIARQPWVAQVVDLVATIMGPIHELLQQVDSDGRRVGDVWGLLERLRITVDRLSLDEACHQPVKKIVKERSDMLLTPIHCAAYLLHPKYRSIDTLMRGTVQERILVENALDYIASQIAGGREGDKMTVVWSSLQDFHGKYPTPGHWGGPIGDAEIEQPDFDPVRWWRVQGGDHRVLRDVVMRCLGAWTTASPCERNWSTHDLVHTKRRNRLGVEQLEKLVLCHWNLKLLQSSHGRGGFIGAGLPGVGLTDVERRAEDYSRFELDVMAPGTYDPAEIEREADRLRRQSRGRRLARAAAALAHQIRQQGEDVIRGEDVIDDDMSWLSGPYRGDGFLDVEAPATVSPAGTVEGTSAESPAVPAGTFSSPHRAVEYDSEGRLRRRAGFTDPLDLWAASAVCHDVERDLAAYLQRPLSDLPRVALDAETGDEECGEPIVGEATVGEATAGEGGVEREDLVRDLAVVGYSAEEIEEALEGYPGRQGRGILRQGMRSRYGVDCGTARVSPSLPLPPPDPSLALGIAGPGLQLPPEMDTQGASAQSSGIREHDSLGTGLRHAVPPVVSGARATMPLPLRDPSIIIERSRPFVGRKRKAESVSGQEARGVAGCGKGRGRPSGEGRGAGERVMSAAGRGRGVGRGRGEGRPRGRPPGRGRGEGRPTTRGGGVPRRRAPADGRDVHTDAVSVTSSSTEEEEGIALRITRRRRGEATTGAALASVATSGSSTSASSGDPDFEGGVEVDEEEAEADADLAAGEGDMS
ncbi:hypothetical protein CBR_g23466 [Chara braunii]|uniref:Uncharacterized protein n=1 Tax=Chara braunii TaxID=69332 RepID=A0A388L4A6_CHABU|nr:hypothetical protein CBR_g23466 [Chara braunii]|eukprot:GBG77140.1 hypothetical protein CBR_g23466 [Chara braunii]